MGAVDQIVKVNITQQTSAVQQASFSIPLIVGSSMSGWTDRVHSYSDPASMLTDGFTTSSPEYIYAQKLYEQSISPNEFLVGKRTAAVEQVDTVAVNTLTNGHQYKLDLNGVTLSHTQTGIEVQEDILNALLTQALAISGAPVSGSVSGTGGSALLTLTSTIAGQSVLYASVDSLLTHVNTVANNGIANDLIAISAENDSWYGLALSGINDADLKQAAVYIEPLKKIFISVSSTSAVAQNVSTDVLSVLGALGLKRTAIMFTASSIEGKEAAWMGQNLPLTPGSNNWSYNTLTGCTPDTLTDSQVSTVIGNAIAGLGGKNGNIYNILGGQSVTRYGKMVGGQYIDITIGIDWLESTLQSNVFGAITAASQLGQKIPYTDKGAGILVSAVKAALDQGVTNGLIDGSSIVITVPSVSSVPLSQRANRIGPTIKFSCRLTGAMNSVQIDGTVSV